MVETRSARKRSKGKRPAVPQKQAKKKKAVNKRADTAVADPRRGVPDPSSIDILPVDIQRRIVELLDLVSLYMLMVTSKAWFALVKAHGDFSGESDWEYEWKWEREREEEERVKERVKEERGREIKAGLRVLGLTPRDGKFEKALITTWHHSI